MNKYFAILVINIILSLLQVSFFNEVFGAFINPNFVIAFAFSLLLLDEEDTSIYSAAVGGLLLDLVSFSTTGLFMLVYSVMLYILYLIRRYVFKNFWFQLIVIFILNFISRDFDNYLNGKHLFENFGQFVISSLLTVFITLMFYALNSYTRDRFIKKEYKLK